MRPAARCARSMIRLRRAVTSAYSAVTKSAFPSTSRKITTILTGVLNAAPLACVA